MKSLTTSQYRALVSLKNTGMLCCRSNTVFALADIGYIETAEDGIRWGVTESGLKAIAGGRP